MLSEREPQAGIENSESLLRHQMPRSAVSCRRPSLVSKPNQVKEEEIPQTLVWSLEDCDSPV